MAKSVLTKKVKIKRRNKKDEMTLDFLSHGNSARTMFQFAKKYTEKKEYVKALIYANLAIEFSTKAGHDGVPMATFIEVRNLKLFLESKMKHKRIGSPKGGIDFRSDKMNVEERMDSRVHGNDREGIQFHLDPAMLERLRDVRGFEPVIVNMQMINNVRAFVEN